MAPEPKARILAVDGQHYFRSFLENLLIDAGYEARVACSMADAARELEAAGPFDVLVLDALLPDSDGVQGLPALRERWPGLQVIVVSGVADIRAAVVAMRHGAADYLLKPVQRATVLESVERALGGAEPSPEQARLVDENLELMGQVSLLERSSALLGQTSPDEVAPALLEMLREEAHAHCGLLWVRELDGGFRLACVSGELDDGTAPESPPIEGAFEAELLRGKPMLYPPDGAGDQLFVPCVQAGSLRAIACLRAAFGRSFEAKGLASCEKLAEMGAAALANCPGGIAAGDGFRDTVSGLPGREFLDEVARVEVRKAHRFGRRLCIVCAELEAELEEIAEAVPRVVPVLRATLRGTDVLASEGGKRFWVLVTDTDPLGGVVLKRRLGQRIRDALAQAGLRAPVAMGAASYPTDGELPEQIMAVALSRVGDERGTLAHELGIDSSTPLVEIGERLLERAIWMPPQFVRESAALLIGELACRPWDRGLLFLAPGTDGKVIFEPLGNLGDLEASTEVFVATEGEEAPTGAAITHLTMPPAIASKTTWIVRFGEAPPYALVSGAERADGARPVFHSSDPTLIEHIAFRLRAEIGFGVRA